MKGMTAEDRARLVASGFITEEPKGKPVAWKLVWTYCGKDQTVLPRGTYGQCAGRKKWASSQTQYANGKLNIKPLYK